MSAQLQLPGELSLTNLAYRRRARTTRAMAVVARIIRGRTDRPVRLRQRREPPVVQRGRRTLRRGMRPCRALSRRCRGCVVDLQIREGEVCLRCRDADLAGLAPSNRTQTKCCTRFDNLHYLRREWRLVANSPPVPIGVTSPRPPLR